MNSEPPMPPVGGPSGYNPPGAVNAPIGVSFLFLLFSREIRADAMMGSH